jgi:hypothetical protein
VSSADDDVGVRVVAADDDRLSEEQAHAATVNAATASRTAMRRVGFIDELVSRTVEEKHWVPSGLHALRQQVSETGLGLGCERRWTDKHELVEL